MFAKNHSQKNPIENKAKIAKKEIKIENKNEIKIDNKKKILNLKNKLKQKNNGMFVFTSAMSLPSPIVLLSLSAIIVNRIGSLSLA